ncbi:MULTISPECIES: hypothetical protein [unclassified Cryobacterium]|uniref:hypothetical protein n=1 Tax=unclassified Cryobacterium TaxID=2649013 RepID=UPI002AB49BED|nr:MULTISPECIES: hypothetical protein [Cryobacterium]MDY7529982.1 hypothetical protein [Cryobacterium sp. 10C2]MDY7557881.1 hypothetical protein [Cryobacterium sp. 10C3]MEB0002509.1 hypothetical protein [Cryobacterium sp. RTC2.1]MEB0203317.1 hypothetical protein [Cryobacterium sp. 5I3]MEB0288449.1 hypothetical protein [Cryobacterium sp. 10S3]
MIRKPLVTPEDTQRVLFTVLARWSTSAISEIGVQLSFAAESAFFAEALACILVALPLNRRLRESVSRDLGRLRKVGKVVLRGKHLELDHDEPVAAAKDAVLISMVFPFQLAYITLLYAGLRIQQAQSLVSGTRSEFSIGREETAARRGFRFGWDLRL